MVKPCRVLVISQNTLFLEALTRMIQTADASVEGQVVDLDMARSFLQARWVDAVIVDAGGLVESEWEIVSCLAHYDQPFQLIIFKPEGNLVTLFRREHHQYTVPECLRQLLGLSEAMKEAG